MPALRNAFRNTLNLSSLHQKWWWNDPDCLLVREKGSKLTEAEVQSAVTLVGLSGGMLILSDDLQRVSPERLKWVSKLTPNLNLCGLPLDLLDNEMPQVYRVELEHAGTVWQLVGIFNWIDKPADLHLIFSLFDYPSGAKLHVFDFWEERYQQTGAKELVFHAVPAHGCKLLRLCEVQGTPQVVGDTIHISMGAEIKSLRIADSSVNIETIGLGRRVEGMVWVWTGKKVVEVAVREDYESTPLKSVDDYAAGRFKLNSE